jgi:cysteine-rich repeat protein
MWLLLPVLLLFLSPPRSADAHGSPIPIAIWGGFDPPEAQCQRIMARSAATCGLEAWRLSDACLRAQLNGGACDVGATQAAIEQAHTAALAAAGSVCRTGVDLGALGFASIVDMNIDIDVFCQELQQAMDSVIYGPVVAGNAIQPTDPATRACIEHTSAAATRLLQTGFRARRRALDRIASERFTPSRKFAIIARSTQRMLRAQQRLHERLIADCPSFATIYPRPLAPYLTLIAERADCLAGRTYVQDFVICPDSVCGNGMREPGERCDDGNTASGDHCRADCQAVTP